MLFGTTRGILVATAVVALLAACSSLPSTHVVLPAPTTVPQMTRLSQQTGAIASVITVSGDETVFTLEPGMSGTLTGKRLDSTAPGQQVALPFNSLALIYYTEPVTDRIPEQSKLPVKDRYPEPRKPGPSEAALSCEALDVELARAEALRWVARENGALPYSSGEKLELHAEHAAIDIGIALLVAAAGSLLFDLAQAISILRLVTSAAATAQMGIWDRLLQQGPSFFRRFTWRMSMNTTKATIKKSDRALKKTP